MGNAFDWQSIWKYFLILLQYLPVSLIILVSSLFVGSVAGALLAAPRLYKWRFVNGWSAAIISFFRGTPIIIQLILIFYGLPELMKPLGLDLTRVSPAVFVVLTFGLNSGASLAEIYRLSVNSIDRGQSEAAASIGMTGWSTFYRIIFPQAVRVAMPHLSNVVVSSLKDTSLAFSVGVMDMMGRGEAIGLVSYRLLEVYISLAIIYYLVFLILQYVFTRLERRMQRYSRAMT
ncbi:amino acid ABC transporter permease [Paenibacillus sp. NPDC058174]|uniref:amino acid ABC transporter permease n=1 Tax=Paenibacillus sp. NPDC058174 TaxID=3346366 RepID=UPI0036DCD69A